MSVKMKPKRGPVVKTDYVLRAYTPGGNHSRDYVLDTKKEADTAARQWEKTRAGAYTSTYERKWRVVE